MRTIITTTVALLTMLNIAAFAQEKGTFTDTRDGKTYKTVKIGTQTWMAENLNYNASSSKCYDDKPANCTKYGRLYRLITARNGDVCPKCWRLPSDEAWDKLYRFVDGTSGTESRYKSPTAGRLLKAKDGWNDIKGKSGNEGRTGNGEDKFGFSALPGGYGRSDGFFLDVGYYGYWLSGSMYSSGSASNYYMNYISDSTYYDRFDDGDLRSVRCVQ
jgi:uncharacterized protein (TIGR02145 family)